jgi:hypothetical protein
VIAELAMTKAKLVAPKPIPAIAPHAVAAAMSVIVSTR